MRTSVPEMIDCILRAEKLILKEENWTQGAKARKADGTECSVEDPEAVQFCAMGAIEACCTDNGQVAWDLENLLQQVVEDDSGYMGYDADTAKFPTIQQFNYFNDEHATHGDIIGIFGEVKRKLGIEPDTRSP